MARLQAYQVLSDHDARAKYNTQLEQALQDEDDDYDGERTGMALSQGADAPAALKRHVYALYVLQNALKGVSERASCSAL